MKYSYRISIYVLVAVFVLLLYRNVSYIALFPEQVSWPHQFTSTNESSSTSSHGSTLLVSFQTTTAEALPASATIVSKIIVMAKLEKEDTSWVAENLPDWQTAIYTVDNPNATLHTSQNKGREANVYLTYIVQNYESLPDIIVFLHSHRDGWPAGWHTDAAGYDNVNSIHDLRLDSVQRDGYVNLRCNPSVGCPNEVLPFRDPPDPTRTTEVAYAAAWKDLFENNNVPREVGVACCSQFAVSKSQVLSRPKADYERYLKWLLETELIDDTSGRVLEYMWHIIYGKDPVLHVTSSLVPCCNIADDFQLP